MYRMATSGRNRKFQWKYLSNLLGCPATQVGHLVAANINNRLTAENDPNRKFRISAWTAGKYCSRTFRKPDMNDMFSAYCVN
jgi:hypothetical protein